MRDCGEPCLKPRAAIAITPPQKPAKRSRNGRSRHVLRAGCLGSASRGGRVPQRSGDRAAGGAAGVHLRSEPNARPRGAKRSRRADGSSAARTRRTGAGGAPGRGIGASARRPRRQASDGTSARAAAPCSEAATAVAGARSPTARARPPMPPLRAAGRAHAAAAQGARAVGRRLPLAIRQRVVAVAAAEAAAAARRLLGGALLRHGRGRRWRVACAGGPA